MRPLKDGTSPFVKMLKIPNSQIAYDIPSYIVVSRGHSMVTVACTKLRYGIEIRRTIGWLRDCNLCR